MKNIFVFLLLGIVVGCSDNSNKNVKTHDSSYNQEIVKDTSQEGVDIYDKVSNLLGLSNIRNGFDTFQLRLWYGTDLNEHTIIIIQSGAANLALKHRFTFFPRNSPEIRIQNKWVDTLMPKKSWEKFIPELSGKLSRLKSEREMSEFDDIDTGESIHAFEIAGKGKYKQYSYPGIKHRSLKSTEVRKIQNLIDFIHSSFRQ